MQRYNSTVVTTVIVPTSLERQEEPVDGVASVATGVAVEHDASRTTLHLHWCSISC